MSDRGCNHNTIVKQLNIVCHKRLFRSRGKVDSPNAWFSGHLEILPGRYLTRDVSGAKNPRGFVRRRYFVRNMKDSGKGSPVILDCKYQ